jgi:membrane-bound lytic murein transglycosylase B
MAVRSRRWHPAHADIWLMPRWVRGVEITVLALALIGLTFLGSAASSGSGGGPSSPMALASGIGPTAGEGAFTLFSTDDSESTTPSSSAPVAAPATESTIPVAPSALVASGLPATALLAYQKAASARNALTPGCGITWPLLAAIGRVESNHGRFAGSILYADGVSAPRIIGIALNGVGTALIRDTDAGLLDGDRVYDRAVGPMQFIPSTWARFAQDGNGDGKLDPFNVFDAASAAADYLCRAGGDLRSAAGQSAAILAYNHSDAYLAQVLATEGAYAAGAGVTIPPVSGAAPTPTSSLPPVNPGPPLSSAPVPASSPTATTPAASGTPTSSPASCSSTTGDPTPSSAAPTSTTVGTPTTDPAPTTGASTATATASTTATATPSVTPSPC